MTNYYQNLTKEAKKELRGSLETKLRYHQDQIDYYRDVMIELEPGSYERVTYLDLINYHQTERSKILDVLNLVKDDN